MWCQDWKKNPEKIIVNSLFLSFFVQTAQHQLELITFNQWHHGIHPSFPLAWYFAAQQSSRQHPEQPPSQTKASLMPGKTVPKWFAECPVEWLMWLVLAAVRQLLIALLAMHISHSLTLPWIARSQTGQENHLGTVFPVVELASGGNWPVIGCYIESHSGQVWKVLFTNNRSESADSIFKSSSLPDRLYRKYTNMWEHVGTNSMRPFVLCGLQDVIFSRVYYESRHEVHHYLGNIVMHVGATETEVSHLRRLRPKQS